MSPRPAEITYLIQTPDRITVNSIQVITCPACGADRGLCLTTAGWGSPVTGSCPNGHIWDERRVSGDGVQRAAIEAANTTGKD